MWAALKSWSCMMYDMCTVPCVNLRWLAFNLIELKLALKWTEILHRWTSQRRSTQVVLFSLGRDTRARLHWNGFLANCDYLQAPFGHPSQVCVRLLTSLSLHWLATSFVVKKYTERLILTAVKETKTQKTKYAKQKNVWNKKLPDISVCKTNLQGLQK